MLRSALPEAPLYIVGGSVRNAYLGLAITDVDIAVDGDAVQAARLVADRWNADIYVMDREREVARVFAERVGQTILVDFARFRGRTLDEDLRDRDFTFNAMAVDLRGDLATLIDPLGGSADLRGRILRLCAAGAIAADPIRALRAVRLSVQFSLKIHPEALTNIRRHAARLAETSPERKRDELFKLLELENVARALRIAQHLGLLAHCVPEIDKLVELRSHKAPDTDAWSQTLKVVHRMNQILTAISNRRTDNTAASFDLGMLVIQLDRFRSELRQHINRRYGSGRGHQPLLVLGALAHMLGRIDQGGKGRRTAETTRALAKRLRLSGQEEARLISMTVNYDRVNEAAAITDLERHRFWYALGESGIDAVLLAAASYLGTIGAELDHQDWLAMVERIIVLLDAWFNRRETLVYPEMLLNGSDIMDLLDIRSGPTIGELLTALREAQATGQVHSVTDARHLVRETFHKLR